MPLSLSAYFLRFQKKKKAMRASKARAPKTPPMIAPMGGAVEATGSAPPPVTLSDWSTAMPSEPTTSVTLAAAVVLVVIVW